MSRRPLLALALCIVACGGSDDKKDGDGFRITSPGNGASNSAPLSPTWPGVRLTYGGAGGVTTMLGYAHRFGRDVVRFSVPEDLRFFRSTDAGQLYDGHVRLGAFAHPLLLVPATVRDGMTWEILGVSGSTLAQLEVKALGEQTTIFGKRPVWRVTQTAKRSIVTDYAEGRGVIESDGLPVRYAVVPLEPRPARKHLPRTKLSKLGDEPLRKQFTAQRASLIHGASGASLRVDGLYPWFSNAFGSGSWGREPGTLCAQLTGGAIGSSSFTERAGDKPPEPPCAHATHHVNGVTVRDGDRLARGPFVDGDGAVRTIGPITLPVSYWAGYWLRAAPDTKDPPESGFRAGGILDHGWLGHEKLSDVYVSSVRADDAVGFVARIGDRLVHARSSKAGFSPMRFIGSVRGTALSASVDANERRHLFVASDGMVDELTITADDAKLTRVAELELPEGHELIAAAPSSTSDRSQLLVLTVQGREDFVGGSREPKMGDLYAWTATLSAPSDPEAHEGPSLEQDIFAMASGPDVKVCWRSGRAELSGWTFGGVAARAFPANADGTCVVVLRDPTAPFEPTAIDGWTIEGPVPNVGRVAIALFYDEARNLKPAPEPTMVAGRIADGSYVSRSLRYSDAGVVIGGVDNAGYYDHLRETLADAGGHGVWMSQSGTLRHWDATYSETKVAGKVYAVLGGGGVLIQGTSNDGIVHPDGRYEDLPNLVEGAKSRYFGGVRGGVMCGWHPTDEIFCRDPDGSFRRKPMGTDEVTKGAFQGDPKWLPGEGGFYGPLYWTGIAETPTAIWHFDPTTLTVSMIVPEGMKLPDEVITLTPAWSTKGELYAAVSRFDELRGMVKLANGKATTHPIPAAWVDRKLRQHALLVGDGLVTLLTTGAGPESVMRVPL